jgi:hypothetical protein
MLLGGRLEGRQTRCRHNSRFVTTSALHCAARRLLAADALATEASPTCSIVLLSRRSARERWCARPNPGAAIAQTGSVSVR